MACFLAVDPLKRSEKGVRARSRSSCPSLPPIDVGCGLAGPKKPGRWTQYILGGRGRERVTVGFCLFPFWPPNYIASSTSTQLKSIHVPQFSLQTGPVRNGWEELFSVVSEWLSVLMCMWKKNWEPVLRHDS